MFVSYSIASFIGRALSVDGLLIHRLENFDFLPPASVKSPHKHEFYELYLFESGSAVHNVDFQTYHIRDNQLFFIEQGKVHHWEKNISNQLTGYRILFTRAFLQNSFVSSDFLFELMFLHKLRYKPLLDISANSKLYTYADLLLNEYETTEIALDNIKALLFLFLNEIKRNTVSTEIVDAGYTKAQILCYQHFLKAVEENYHKELSLNDYAKIANLSTRQLSRMVKEVSGKTLNKIVVDRRILQSKRLLKYSDLPISAIAHEVGFKEPSYFAKVFKMLNDSTPLEFRKQLKI